MENHVGKIWKFIFVTGQASGLGLWLLPSKALMFMFEEIWALLPHLMKLSGNLEPSGQGSGLGIGAHC